MAPAVAAADDVPTVVRTSIVVSTVSHDGYAKKPKDPFIRSWRPRIQFEIVGPLPAGGQLTAEYLEGTKVWATNTLPSAELAAGVSAKIADNNDVPPEAGVITTGDVPFRIRFKNALDNTDKVLFTGSFRVDKFAGNEPQKKNGSFEYFVNQDAMLPYGLVWFDQRDAQAPILMASMWVRGGIVGSKDAAYLMFNGKPMCNTTTDAGGAINGPSVTNSPGGESRTWQRADIYFNCARAFSKYADGIGVHEPAFNLLDKHPGDYEVKLLRGGKLTRTLKFTIGADGALVDSGLVEKNHLGGTRSLVPVKLEIDTEDGQKLDTSAWKKGLYGNVVAGFAPK